MENPEKYLDDELDYKFEEEDSKGKTQVEQPLTPESGRVDEGSFINQTLKPSEASWKPSETPVETPEEKKIKSDLKAVIHRYRSNTRFKKYLVDQGFKSSQEQLNKMNIGQLKEMLETMQLAIQNRTTNNINEIVFSTIEAVELASKMYLGEHVKIEGLARGLRDNDCFLDSLEEIQILQGSNTLTSPYQRVAWTVVQNAAFIHGKNATLEIAISRRDGSRSDIQSPVERENKRRARRVNPPSPVEDIPEGNGSRVITGITGLSRSDPRIVMSAEDQV